MIRNTRPQSLAGALWAVMCPFRAQPASYTLLNPSDGPFGWRKDVSSQGDGCHG